MAAVSAHELTRIRLCKVNACGNELRASAASRGPYAGLCEEHYELQRRRMSSIQQGQGDPGLEGAGDLPAMPVSNGNGNHNHAAPAKPVASTTPTRYADKARTLVDLGRKVDRAHVRADHAKRECEPKLRSAQRAREEAEEMVARFRDAVRELLD